MRAAAMPPLARVRGERLLVLPPPFRRFALVGGRLHRVDHHVPSLFAMVPPDAEQQGGAFRKVALRQQVGAQAGVAQGR